MLCDKLRQLLVVLFKNKRHGSQRLRDDMGDGIRNGGPETLVHFWGITLFEQPSSHVVHEFGNVEQVQMWKVTQDA